MKPFTFLCLFMLMPFLCGCTFSGGQDDNLIKSTIDDLQKEGISFDKETLLDLFRFFWQLKKDYQSMSLALEPIRTFSRECYRKVREKCDKIKTVKAGNN